MRFYFNACILSTIFELVTPYNDNDILIQNPGRLAREINSAQKSWVAEDYFKRPVTVGDARKFFGLRLGRNGLGSSPSFGSNYAASPQPSTTAAEPVKSNFDRIVNNDFEGGPPIIPRTFDVRKFFPYCKALTTIRDQANCGSCWAVSASNVLADRFCIATGGKINVHISAQNLVTCCKSCGNGCDGGNSIETFKHFLANGEITGGDFGSEYGCKPYSISPEKGTDTTNIDSQETPACEQSCTNPKYGIPFEREKRYKVMNWYEWSSMNVTQIQQDLMLNGPSVAAFQVYTDFMLYRSGVYRHVKGINTGGHAVRLVGWGRENGMDYWLLANSWNKSWGLEGTFKMRRGGNECLIESHITAGEPDLNGFKL